MKRLLLAALLCCVTLLPARADIPPPKPSVFTVRNLSAFPKYKFLVALEHEDRLQPLEEGKIYQVNLGAWLYVQKGDGKPECWATVGFLHTGRQGESVKILIDDVQPGINKIEVLYNKRDDPTLVPPKKGAARALDGWPHFFLAGLGCGGLILLARRRNPRDAAL